MVVEVQVAVGINHIFQVDSLGYDFLIGNGDDEKLLRPGSVRV